MCAFINIYIYVYIYAKEHKFLIAQCGFGHFQRGVQRIHIMKSHSGHHAIEMSVLGGPYWLLESRSGPLGREGMTTESCFHSALLKDDAFILISEWHYKSN